MNRHYMIKPQMKTKEGNQKKMMLDGTWEFLMMTEAYARNKRILISKKKKQAKIIIKINMRIVFRESATSSDYTHIYNWTTIKKYFILSCEHSTNQPLFQFKIKMYIHFFSSHIVALKVSRNCWFSTTILNIYKKKNLFEK